MHLRPPAAFSPTCTPVSPRITVKARVWRTSAAPRVACRNRPDKLRIRPSQIARENHREGSQAPENWEIKSKDVGYRDDHCGFTSHHAVTEAQNPGKRQIGSQIRRGRLGRFGRHWTYSPGCWGSCAEWRECPTSEEDIRLKKPPPVIRRQSIPSWGATICRDNLPHRLGAANRPSRRFAARSKAPSAHTLRFEDS
jgi:hypothetical protein